MCMRVQVCTCTHVCLRMSYHAVHVFLMSTTMYTYVSTQTPTLPNSPPPYTHPTLHSKPGLGGGFASIIGEDACVLSSICQLGAIDLQDGCGSLTANPQLVTWLQRLAVLLPKHSMLSQLVL